MCDLIPMREGETGNLISALTNEQSKIEFFVENSRENVVIHAGTKLTVKGHVSQTGRNVNNVILITGNKLVRQTLLDSGSFQITALLIDDVQIHDDDMISEQEIMEGAELLFGTEKNP